MTPIDLDQMFDLDMALTPPSTMLDVSGNQDQNNTMKLSESNASRHNHQVDQLRTVTATGDQVLCTVCMEAFRSSSGVGTVKQVPCGHVFHAICIEKWLSVHNSCPLCRFSGFSAGQGPSTRHFN